MCPRTMFLASTFQPDHKGDKVIFGREERPKSVEKELCMSDSEQ